MFYFCCNECQRCWHRERGTAPKGWNKAEFNKLLREEKVTLDAHEAAVRGR